MRPVVCIACDTIGYPEGGGHRWVYLNWALGLRAAGCEVAWLELLPAEWSRAEARAAVRALHADLEPFGIADRTVLVTAPSDQAAAERPCKGELPEADLLVDLRYGLPIGVLTCFPRTALVDIDPGLTQLWMSRGEIDPGQHDVYFTTGENVGGGRSRVPDCGISWNYIPPCIALEEWPVTPQPAREGAYTTISHWWPSEDEGWIYLGGEWIEDSKREGFQDLLELPARTGATLELALGGVSAPEEVRTLQAKGWRVSDAWSVGGSVDDYRGYIQRSRGEFSGAKPSTRILQAGWTSDRSLCYLASGKPVIVRDTGPSSFLPKDEGMFRFDDQDGAARALELAERDYEHHCRHARKLAEQYFDAETVARSLLERTLA